MTVNILDFLFLCGIYLHTNKIHMNSIAIIREILKTGELQPITMIDTKKARLIILKTG